MKYRMFNRFMEIYTDKITEAFHLARVNAGAVEDTDSGKIIMDFRSEESEADEKG